MHLEYSSRMRKRPFSVSCRYLAATSPVSSPKVSSRMVCVMYGSHSLCAK